MYRKLNIFCIFTAYMLHKWCINMLRIICTNISNILPTLCKYTAYLLHIYVQHVSNYS